MDEPPVRDSELVTLLDREAVQLSDANDHCAAALMRMAARRIRQQILEASGE